MSLIVSKDKVMACFLLAKMIENWEITILGILLNSSQVKYSHFASNHWNLLQAVFLFVLICTLHS